MLVKVQTFRKEGRYPTASARATYLERDGRAVERATLNINDEQRPWAEMDKTREQYHLRGAVVGREYILSPSPEDMATPAQMREFALEWATRSFPNAEAVIVVHEDNKERLSKGVEPIAHVHVYVNTPDLETGRKIVINNQHVRELHDMAQDMSAKRGWSEQERYFDKQTERIRQIESKRSDYERRPKWQRLHERKNPDYEKSGLKGRISRHEYEQKASGTELDKTFIRRSLKEAAQAVASNSETTLKDELNKRGIRIEEAANGDLKYSREEGGRAFRGKTLGAEFEREALMQSIQTVRSHEYGMDIRGAEIELG
ncbi:relaxase/mobilization nuclease domain-containing protein [Eggerthella sp. YY7918]|uniref:relaxase/mobilization nuclease domain-containing protein n=1 Tax=Eggerthella sp. (strain YY7918) TaxID=502558 RepID=UPI0002171298|nr:relaxase/mobilization nuclease domain-containing protein [Eggerthella sp. YY7918]BAK45828.1 hypothetical protein EGYY_28510 [Eggerthella sp. YY7918]